MPEDSAVDLVRTCGLDSDDDVYEVEALALFHEVIDRLARRRDKLGLTQAQVADRMGTSQSAVAKLESHRHDPQMITLARYMAALRLDAQGIAAVFAEHDDDGSLIARKTGGGKGSTWIPSMCEKL